MWSRGSASAPSLPAFPETVPCSEDHDSLAAYLSWFSEATSSTRTPGTIIVLALRRETCVFRVSARGDWATSRLEE